MEAVLPVRLRSGGETDPDTNLTREVPSPRQLALLLDRAQRAHNVDLLSYLGVQQGRWKAVVWIITGMVDDLWKNESSMGNKEGLPGPWQGTRSLHEMTAATISLDDIDPPTTLSSFRTMDDVTIKSHPLYRPLDARIRHEALGQIWRSLGNMIIADAARAAKATDQGRNITPEILEIIALLHHHGIMPASIYSYQPSEDSTALRQPPTLHLLSSHILTSLTDAAWRAHETLVVEEAKARGGQYASLRPELPGSMYKVRVAGLGHEVWLELVLWSCLHGGWTLEGASILENIARQGAKGQWTVLSWRELVQPVIKAGQENDINWDEVRYLLNSGSVYGDPTSAQASKKRVKRTISGEVIAAFVDALVNSVRTSVGERGISPGAVLIILQSLKTLLERNNLSLGTTSWDAIVLRLIESQGIDIAKEPGVAEKILQLSPQFGQELDSANAPARTEDWQPLPVYTLDGTAAPLGVMHRILRSYIHVGNMGGALRVFTALQEMTDRNKQISIKNFFRRDKALERRLASEELDFESHYSGIEYPGFFPQIPVTILAPFLDLVTEARAFDFGTWLLRSEDVDGPIISESMYSDLVMAPSLVRFASAIGDKAMLVKLLERQTTTDEGPTKLPERTLLAFLDNQLITKNYKSVQTMLDIIAKNPQYSLNETTVASLIRAVLREPTPSDALAFDHESDLVKAFRNLWNSTKSQIREKNRSQLYPPFRTMLFVLASIDEKWADLCPLKGRQAYTLNNKSFNAILEGVLDSYGSERGKGFLSQFWSPALDSFELPSDFQDIEERDGSVTRMSAETPGRYVSRVGTDRFAFDVFGKSFDKSEAGRPKIGQVFGSFRPSTSTLRIILRKCLEEHEGLGRTQLSSDLEWAARRMKLLGLRNRDTREEIERVAGQSDEVQEILNGMLGNGSEERLIEEDE